MIGSICYGALTPAQFILFGKTTDDFVEFTLCDRGGYCKNSTVDLEDSMTDIAAWYIGFAVGNFLFAWMGLGLFALSAERQVHKMRLAMFKNVIYQEIGWFDEHSSGELITRLTEYVFHSRAFSVGSSQLLQLNLLHLSVVNSSVGTM